MVVGLVNPEPSYARNRHNLGFRVVDSLGEQIGAEWGRKFEQGEARPRSMKKPGAAPVQTRRSCSSSRRPSRTGRETSVAPAGTVLQKLALSQVLVVHDELDPELGRMPAQAGCGAAPEGTTWASIDRGCDGLAEGIWAVEAGHRPAASRVGCRRFYVLSDFSKAEEEVVAVEVQSALAALKAVISDGVNAEGDDAAQPLGEILTVTSHGTDRHGPMASAAIRPR